MTLEGHTHSVYCVAAYPTDEGIRIVSGSADQTVKIWDAETGENLRTLVGHRDVVKSVAASSDGHRIVSGSMDRTVKIWDADTGACLHTLEGHRDGVSSVAIFSDGTRILSGSDDKTVKIWDAETGACLRTLEGHTDYVTSVAVSSDGTRIISGSGDETVKIWDAASGELLYMLKGTAGHTSSVNSVAVYTVPNATTDTMRIVSGSDDKTIKIWDIKEPVVYTKQSEINTTNCELNHTEKDEEGNTVKDEEGNDLILCPLSRLPITNKAIKMLDGHCYSVEYLIGMHNADRKKSPMTREPYQPIEETLVNGLKKPIQGGGYNKIR